MKGILPLLSSEFFFRRRTGEKWKNYFLERKKRLSSRRFSFLSLFKSMRKISSHHIDFLFVMMFSTPTAAAHPTTTTTTLSCSRWLLRFYAWHDPTFEVEKISFDDAGLVWEWHERRRNWVRITLSASPGLFVSLAEPSHHENVYEFFPYFRLISLRSLSSCTMLAATDDVDTLFKC